MQRSISARKRINRDVFDSSTHPKLTSLIPQNVWNSVNHTEDKEILFHSKTMNAMPLKVSGTINRSDTLTKWALSHPKCTTNVTSYVGQTAKMHCCLARLDRDLSVKMLYVCLFLQFDIL